MSEFNEEHEHHADPLDVSVAQQERLLRAELAVRKPVGPLPTGFCLDPNCETQLVSDEEMANIRSGGLVPAGTRRWCNADCREAAERERIMASRR